MAGFLDFAFGTFLSAIVGSVLRIPMNVWCLIIGGFMAQSPDIVGMVKTRLNKKQLLANDHHESWDHWPAFMIPLGTIIGFIVGGWYWGTVSFLCLFFHYNHDMEIGDSGGIAFFAPFEFRFFTWWRGFYDPKTSAMSKPETELEPVIHHNWLKPSKMSVREMILGSAALGLSSSMVMNYKIGILLFAFCWVGTILVWYKAKILKLD